jgi:carbamoyl-phosphate synthase large subunit
MRLGIMSIGSKVPTLVAAKNALGRAGGGVLVGFDRDAECIGRRFVDEFHTSVSGVDVDVLVPTRDAELAWSPAHPRAVVSGNCGRFSDKLDFAILCGELGIPHPNTSLNPEHITAPMIAKPRHGAGSREVQLVYTRRGIGGKPAQEMIYQEYVAGTEYSCDAYVRSDGVVHGVVARSRDKVASGESAVSTTVNSALVEKTVDYIGRFGGLRGPVNLQFIDDTLIEVNPRVSGGLACSIRAGLDVFYWMLLEARGDKLPPMRYRPVRMVRYKADMFEVVP